MTYPTKRPRRSFRNGPKNTNSQGGTAQGGSQGNRQGGSGQGQQGRPNGSFSSPPPRPASTVDAETIRTSEFTKLGLIEALVRAVHDEGYTQPTPIQTQVIPSLIAGRDVLGCAQTGTGKTAAFVLPILQRLAAEGHGNGTIRTLVLSPTRELAAQIGERVGAYGRHIGLKHAVIFGGVGQRPQENALRSGVDILIATPGRLLDLMQQRFANLSYVTQLVLDEADRMLDMGFIHDVKRIVAAVPHKRQTLLFSATMPKEVSGLANAMLKDPVYVSVTPEKRTAATVEQSVIFVPKADKRALLETVLLDPQVSRAIVFMRTKHGANRLAEQLDRAGIVSAAIHGNKSQGARERALEGFRGGTCRVLIATDVASRGIDVDGITHVINFEMPDTPESYVHRIGRTGRAGAEGKAISFCDPSERKLLLDIERLVGNRIPVSNRQGQPMPSRAPQPVASGHASGQPSGSPVNSQANGPRQSDDRPQASQQGRAPSFPGDSNRQRRRRF